MRSARSQLLREALALWRGPPLADLAVRELRASGEIRRLEELRLAGARGADRRRPRAGRRTRARRRARGARRAARRSGSVSAGQLMLALYRAGRQAEALGAYHDARRVARGRARDRAVARAPAALPLDAAAGGVARARAARGAAPTTTSARSSKALLGGRLVIVLGAGVNVATPTTGCRARRRSPRTSSSPSTARRSTPATSPRSPSTSTLTKGVGPLYDELHALYARDCAPRPVDRGARAARRVCSASSGAPRQLIVTTNFDDALERALRRGRRGRRRRHLRRARPEPRQVPPPRRRTARATVVEVPNAYAALSLERRTVILKIHGGIDMRPDREWESFVVSEDDHIDHLAQAEISGRRSRSTLAARLRRSHFLFLGYPLEDWGLRVFLHRVWGRERVGYRSWAIGHELGGVEQELWRERGIESFDLPLDEYLDEPRARLAARARELSSGGPLSPYRGLMPFEDSDLDVLFFFGRERERELIEANLMASRLTVLYGETGVGKSSVLRAGVAHHLRGAAKRNLARTGEPGLAVVVFDTWRDDPLQALRTAIAEAVTQCPRRHAPAARRGRPARRGAARPGARSSTATSTSSSTRPRSTSSTTAATTARTASRVEFPAVVNTPGPARELPARDPRGRAREARRLQGPGSRTCSGTTSAGAPRAGRRRGPRSSSRSGATTGSSSEDETRRASSRRSSTPCSNRSSPGRSTSDRPGRGAVAARRRRRPDRDRLPELARSRGGGSLGRDRQPESARRRDARSR